MKIFITFILNVLAVAITAYLLPGVQVSSLLTVIIVALVLGLVNIFIKPIILLVTLPLNILTLGLLTFVINALLILLVAYIVPGFVVLGFWWALLFSLVLSIVHMILFAIFEPKK